MPWNETDPMEQRMKFLMAHQESGLSMSASCRRYGVSRKTGYKWLARYRSEGLAGLRDHGRAPHGHPRVVPDEIVAAVLVVRHQHRTWGRRKVRAWLLAHHPGLSWPAASTIGNLFDRAGLTVPRRLRRRVPPNGAPLAHCRAANDVWTVDFKGWFRTGDGARCDPLTLQDAHSRYLLRCDVLASAGGAQVWPQFELAFWAHGLPKTVRSENGTPFASRAAGGLSRLSVRLIKAGVMPERIAPGKPQENGRHERFHLTLKQETAEPPARALEAQQQRFDRFQRVYNEERPHEALDDETPVRHYCPSARAYNGRLESPDYPDHHERRRVRTNGEIKWRGGTVFISEVLVGEPVGLEAQANGSWRVSFGPIGLGHIDLAGRLGKPRPRICG